MTKNQLNLLAKILFLLGMLGFLLPFVTVSAFGQSESVSGIELMLTVFSGEAGEIETVDDVITIILLLASFLIGGLGIAFTTGVTKESILASGYAGIAGAVSLIILRAMFSGMFTQSGFGFLASFNLGIGWWIPLVAYIVAALCSFICATTKGQEPSEIQKNTVINAPPSAVEAPAYEIDQVEEAETYISLEEEQPQTPVINLNEKTAIRTTLIVKLHIQYEGNSTEYLIKEFPCLIGRDSGSCEIKIEDSKVSRTHARLTVKDDSVFIEDLKSSNGTGVNGQLISDVTEVLSGDEIVIGTTHLIFEVRDYRQA